MKKASTASVFQRTQDQEREFRSVMANIAAHVANLALDKIQANRKKWQDVIEKSDPLRNAVADFVLAKLGELTFSLLKHVTSVSVPAIQETTLTEEFLKKEYNIGYIGNNFRRLFLDKRCKLVPAGSTAFHALQKDSLDPPIMDELGKKATIPLGQFFWHIRQQKNGQAGHLLTNNYMANIGYVEVGGEDGNGEVWAVGADWNPDRGYWSVGAARFPARIRGALAARSSPAIRKYGFWIPRIFEPLAL